MSNIKEAIAIVLDVGPSMSKLGDDHTYLQQACHLVTLILQRKLFSESKDEVMLVMFGTSESKNELAEEGDYKHISIDHPLSAVTFELIEQFKKFTTPGVSHSADFIDALIVAMDELKTKTENKKAFGAKRIILLSALSEAYSINQLDDVIASMQEQQFGFTYLGPEDGGMDGEDEEKKDGMEVVARIVEAVDGDQFTFDELYPCLSTIQSRSIRPTAWKASLTIASSLQLPVCMYAKVKEFKPRSFSKVWVKDPSIALQRLTTYHLPDSTTTLDKTDIIDGNRYGTTLIPSTAEDKKAMTLKTEKCFKVLGFTKADNVKRHQYFGDSVWLCMADKDNQAAQLLFSSLIHALHDTSMVAIVRKVHSARGGVQVGCLMPQIKADSEFMYYIQLPFSEDIRQSPFKPLPLDTSSTNEHAFNEEQGKAVKELIDCMNLSKISKKNGGGDDEDDEDEDEELFKARQVYNPYLQRLYQCLEHRALKPDDPSLPPIPEVIKSLMELPDHKVAASKPALDKLKQLFKVVHQEKKNGVLVDNAKAEVNKAGGELANNVSPVNDFGTVLGQNVLSEQKAYESMMVIVQSLMQPPSFHLLTQCLTALRKHTLNEGKYKYNDFMLLLRKVALDMTYWPLLSTHNLGLVTKAENALNGVSAEEAKEFLSIK